MESEMQVEDIIKIILILTVVEKLTRPRVFQ